jgi:hypothetical protein
LLREWDERIRNHAGWAGVSLFFVTFLVYSGSLANRFVFDDLLQILQNPFVLNPHLWKQNFTTASFGFTGAQTNFYRPLQFFSYWLVNRLDGPTPGAFHLYQLLLYAGAVTLVYRIGRDLFEDELAAFAGALLWSLHPLHIEAVAYIPGLPYAGSGFFYLLGFRLFLRAEKAENRRLLRHGLAALAYFPAPFFNEMALSLPLILLVYWFFLGTPDSWVKRGARWVRWVPYAGGVAGYLAIRIAVLGHFSQARDFWKISPRVVGAAAGLLGEHTRLFFWPVNLNVFHMFDLNSSLRSPWPWLALLGIVAAFFFRKRVPMLGFLVVWWVVALLPCLDARQLSFPLLAERFDYLPSVGLCLAMAFVCVCWLPRRLPDQRLAPVVVPGLALIASLWAIQDRRLIPNWHDNETMWNYSARVAPDAPLVHLYQAEVRFNNQDLDGAAREYQTAMRLNQASFLPLLGVDFDANVGLGRVAQWRNRPDEALGYLEKAIRLAPHHAEGYKLLGQLYFPRGDYAKAAGYFAHAVKINPQDVELRFFLGTCLMKLGKPRQAAEQFHAARDVDSTYYQAFEAEVRALEAAGDSAGAAQVRSSMPQPQHHEQRTLDR